LDSVISICITAAEHYCERGGGAGYKLFYWNTNVDAVIRRILSLLIITTLTPGLTKNNSNTRVSKRPRMDTISWRNIFGNAADV